MEIKMSMHDKLRFEYEMDVTYSGGTFTQWLCEKIRQRDDMLIMSANGYKELTESHDDLKARFTACKDECLRLGEMITGLQDELESAITEKQVANTSIDMLSGQFDELKEQNATLTEKLDLAQTVIRSLAKQESWDKAQIICINYLFDQTGEDLENYVFPKT